MWRLSQLDGGPHTYGDKIGWKSGGLEGEKIHLKQNKGDRSLLNTVQGTGGQLSSGETACNEAMGGGCFFKKEGEALW